MKYFDVHRLDINDFYSMVSVIKKFIYEERIPMPVQVQMTNEHADFFAQDKVLIIVSSLALIKL